MILQDRAAELIIAHDDRLAPADVEQSKLQGPAEQDIAIRKPATPEYSPQQRQVLIVQECSRFKDADRHSAVMSCPVANGPRQTTHRRGEPKFGHLKFGS